MEGSGSTPSFGGIADSHAKQEKGIKEKRVEENGGPEARPGDEPMQDYGEFVRLDHIPINSTDVTGKHHDQ